MSVEKSLEGVTQFWKNNQKLVEQIRGTGEDAVATIKKLGDQLEQSQKLGQELVDGLGTAKFQITKDDDVKKKQQGLISQIQEVNNQIEEFKDSPELTTGLYSDRASLYLQLANTFDETIIGFIPFTTEEVTEINGLLQQAALDAAARQKLANVLDAAVKLTEMALKVAVKVATA